MPERTLVHLPVRDEKLLALGVIGEAGGGRIQRRPRRRQLFLTCSTRHVAAPADWAVTNPSAAEKAIARHTPSQLPARLNPSLP